MAVLGSYLGAQVRGQFINSLTNYRECIFLHVLPAFANLNERAEGVADDYYARKANQPAEEYEDVDLADTSEVAQAKALAFYETMSAVRQTMLNLLAAGLFHLVEQQLTQLCREDNTSVNPPKNTYLQTVEGWYAEHFSLQLNQLASWGLIDELRMLSNTVKHAQINQTERLRKRRPDLFRNPLSLELDALLGDEEITIREPELWQRPILQPLAGADLFVSESLLKIYADGVEAFFGEIACHFEVNEHGTFPV